MAALPIQPPPITHATQYPPANETSAELWFERSNLEAVVICGVAYGIHATLFFHCVTLLWALRRQHPRRSAFYLAYVCIHFACGTLVAAGEARWAEMVWIDNRGYPGGPLAFLVQQDSYWVAYMANIVPIIPAWLQDWLLLYRFFVIYGSKYFTLIIPGAAYFTSTVISILLLIQLNAPGGSRWHSISFNLFTTFWGLEIGTNLLLTVLIVGKLMYRRRQLRKVMGATSTATYVTISAMIVESALLYSAAGLAFVISYASHSSFQNIMLPLSGQIQSIAPLLIVLRVSQGQAATKATMSQSKGTLVNQSSRSRLAPIVFKSTTVTEDRTSHAPSTLQATTGGSATQLESMELTDIKRGAITAV